MRQHGVVSSGKRPTGARSSPILCTPCVWQAEPAAHEIGRTCQMTTLWHSDASHRRTTCSRGPSRGTLLRRLRGSPCAPSASGEHVRDVLSATSARHEVGTSRRAVVTRERRWLVEEWNGPYGAHGESLQEACGSGHRCSPRPPPGKPSTIPCTPELVPSVGPSGTAWEGRGGLRRTRYCENELSCPNYSRPEPGASRRCRLVTATRARE